MADVPDDVGAIEMNTIPPGTSIEDELLRPPGLDHIAADSPVTHVECATSPDEVDDGSRSEHPDTDWEDVDDKENLQSFVHAVRKSKTKVERNAAKGGKAGNKGRFQGPMRTYLVENLPIYMDIRKTDKNKNKKLDTFWHNLRVGFWDRFKVKEARALWQEGKDWDSGQVMRAVNTVSG